MLGIYLTLRAISLITLRSYDKNKLLCISTHVSLPNSNRYQDIPKIYICSINAVQPSRIGCILGSTSKGTIESGSDNDATIARA